MLFETCQLESDVVVGSGIARPECFTERVLSDLEQVGPLKSDVRKVFASVSSIGFI